MRKYNCCDLAHLIYFHLQLLLALLHGCRVTKTMRKHDETNRLQQYS